MGFSYTGLQATALNLLTKFGSTVTLRRFSGAYVPSTGTSPATQTDTSRKGVLLPASATDQGKDMVMAGDRLFYMDGLAAVMQDDHVIVGSKTYRVVDSKPLQPDGSTTLLYELLLRGVK